MDAKRHVHKLPCFVNKLAVINQKKSQISFEGNMVSYSGTFKCFVLILIHILHNNFDKIFD